MISNLHMSGSFVKVVVTVPVTHANTLRKAIGEAGGGKIGDYKHCSFSSTGTGRFLPQAGAQPAVGKIGELEEVPEERIEITIERSVLEEVAKAIRNNHPYEEIALDVYPLEDIDF